MSKDYFARYESPNIVIVPTVSLKKDSVKSTAATVSQNIGDESDVSCAIIKNSYPRHNDCNVSSNAPDSSFDSVEEALKQLHNVQSTPTILNTNYDPIPLTKSKYSAQKNLIDLTENNNIRTDTVNSTSNENKQEINSKVVKHSNIKERVEQDFIAKTEQSIDCTQPHITSVNQTTRNISSTNTSHKTENQMKHTSDRKTLTNLIKTKLDDSSKAVEKEKKRGDCAEKTYTDKNKILQLRPSSDIKKYDIKLNPKYKIPIISKEQKREYENIETNEVILSHEKKEDITPGALKRYLEYQRFLGKCYEKNAKESSTKESNVATERTRDHIKTIKEKAKVKPPSEERKQLKVKSKSELMKRKQEYRKKLKSCVDVNINRSPCTSNDNKKNKEKSKERLRKKEEIRIKLTSYIASKKKKEKASERNTESTKSKKTHKSPNRSDRKEQSKDKRNESSKHKSQKDKCKGNACKHSESKKPKDGISNKIKKMGMKRKNTDSEQEKKKKARKVDASTKVDDYVSEKRRHRTPTPKRIVDVLKQSSCHNLPDRCSTNIDLRSKLTRKRTLKQSNEQFDEKSLSKRENLLVTLKQHVHPKTPVSNKPKIKKCKKIKLVINIKCSDSNVDYDEVEPEISNENASPQYDLSFLDDIDIDGIVDSLNAGQKTKSPVCENMLGNREDFEPGQAQEKDLILKDFKDSFPLIKNEKSNVCSINNPIDPLPKTNANNILEMEYNDDVYEVIDITDENENNIILVDDDEDTSTVIASQKQNTKQTLATQSKSNNYTDIQKIPIIPIRNDSRDSSDVITITDVKIEEKHEVNTLLSPTDDTLQPKNNTKETGSNNIASGTTNTQSENYDINIKSECIQKTEIVSLAESNSNNGNKNVKKELDSAITTDVKKENTNVDIQSFNIKNEACEASVLAVTDIKREVSNDIKSSPISVKKEPSGETLHTKTENTVQSNTDSNIDDAIPMKEVSVNDEIVIKSENGNSVSNKHDSQSGEVNDNINKATIENKTMPVGTKTSEPCKQVDNTESDCVELLSNNEKSKTDVPTTKTHSIPEMTPKTKNATNASSFSKTTGKKYIEPEKSRRFGSTHKGVFLSMTDPIFERLSEYLYMVDGDILLDSIHRGHFSNIYKCKNPNGAVYAVKVLKKRFISMGIYKQRIFMDLQKVPHTDGNSILDIIKYVHLDGWLCLKTEYYPKTLAQALSSQKPLDINVVQNLSRQLVSAVKRLTCNYIVHSDIKPEHILLSSREDRLKLCGFDRGDYNYNIKITPSTGSTNYRAPEIILGFDADYKIDVWATAAVMYEMASGTKLFPGHYNNQILYSQMCISGPVGIDMLEKCTKLGNHFLDKNFMRQFGPKMFVCVKHIPVKTYKLNAVLNTARSTSYDRNRTLLPTTESSNKNKMLLELLKQMLVINPRNRISIIDVASNEFLCKT